MTIRTLALSAAGALLLAGGCGTGGDSADPSPAPSAEEAAEESAPPSPEPSPSPSEQQSPPPDQGLIAMWWIAADASEHGSVVAVTFREDGLISVVGDPAGPPRSGSSGGDDDDAGAILCGGEFDPEADPPLDFSVECGEIADLMDGPSTSSQTGTADLTENSAAGPGTVLEVTWDANGATDYYTFTGTGEESGA
ncbi:hypothetical protein [Nocardiopsis coralliicola]